MASSWWSTISYGIFQWLLKDRNSELYNLFYFTENPILYLLSINLENAFVVSSFFCAVD